MRKGLFYFITFDLIIAAFLIINFNFKANNNGSNIVTPVIDWVNALEPKEDSTSSNGRFFQSKLNVSDDTYVTHKQPICVTYGPLTLEQKSSLDVILKNNQVGESELLNINKSPLYEIIWNLGSDKLTAIELFEKQKNEGALEDEKFKLLQNTNGQWIVPVSTIAGNMSVAKKMTESLSKSAQGLGGKWEFKNKSDGYFYQFKNMSLIPNKTINIINNSIDTLKTPC